jgi:hypothetical protein
MEKKHKAKKQDCVDGKSQKRKGDMKKGATTNEQSENEVRKKLSEKNHSKIEDAKTSISLFSHLSFSHERARKKVSRLCVALLSIPHLISLFFPCVLFCVLVCV